MIKQMVGERKHFCSFGPFVENIMRSVMVVSLLLLCLLSLSPWSLAADLESRALTHYVPQDFLENVVRKEGWTEVVLKPYNGVRKGDVARIWSGGMIDHGNGTQPGVHVAGPAGPAEPVPPAEAGKMALSQSPDQAYALLFKTEDGKIYRCQTPGKPVEVPLARDAAKLWIGFNDARDRYRDNHLGKGRRYEFDPLWVRIEVIRTIVD
jgi:hypothetical protein